MCGAGARDGVDGAPDRPRVRVDPEPRAVAVDPSAGSVYVEHAPSGTISVLDARRHHLLATIPVGRSPRSLALDPVAQRLYVGDTADDSVAVVDVRRHRVVGAVPVAFMPDHSAVNPITRRVNVPVAWAYGLTVFDGRTNRVVAAAPTAAPPDAVAVDPAGTGPRAVSIDPRSHAVYVVNHVDGTVSVVDGIRLERRGTIAVGDYPVAAALDPQPDRLYVLQGTNDASDGRGRITAIDAPTGKMIASQPLGGDPAGIAVSFSTSRLSVSDDARDVVSVVQG